MMAVLKQLIEVLLFFVLLVTRSWLLQRDRARDATHATSLFTSAGLFKLAYFLRPHRCMKIYKPYNLCVCDRRMRE